MKTYPLHPVTKLFPPLPRDKREALKASISQHGCTVPLVLWQGQVIDGRHRQEICQALGVRFETVEFEGTEAEAVDHAWQLQDARREWRSDTERALAAGELMKLLQRGQANGNAAEQAAGTMGVPQRTVERAGRVAEKASRVVKKAVKDKTISLFDASFISDQPKDVQNEAVERVAAGLAPTAKAALEQIQREQAGGHVPPAVAKILLDAPLWDAAILSLQRAATALTRLEQSDSWEAAGDKRSRGSSCLTQVTTLRSMKPQRVCDKCGGDGCRACRDKGFLAGDAHAPQSKRRSEERAGTDH